MEVGHWSTNILLDDEEVKEFCKPGEEANTCIWLVLSGAGFECLYYNKPQALLDRWEKGLTVAKRDGCDKVRGFSNFLEGEHTF